MRTGGQELPSIHSYVIADIAPAEITFIVRNCGNSMSAAEYIDLIGIKVYTEAGTDIVVKRKQGRF